MIADIMDPPLVCQLHETFSLSKFYEFMYLFEKYNNICFSQCIMFSLNFFLYSCQLLLPVTYTPKIQFDNLVSRSTDLLFVIQLCM